MERAVESGLERALDPAGQVEVRAEPTLEEEDPLEEDHAHVLEPVTVATELRRGLLGEIDHPVAGPRVTERKDDLRERLLEAERVLVEVSGRAPRIEAPGR